MKSGIKYNIYIGLLKSNMIDKIDKNKLLNSISQKFINLGIIGFNSKKQKDCFWSGKKEPCLKVSFINTFNIHLKDLLIVLESLKIEFSQESILIEEEKVLYDFI